VSDEVQAGLGARHGRTPRAVQPVFSIVVALSVALSSLARGKRSIPRCLEPRWRG